MNKILIILIGLLFSVNSYCQSADEMYDILDEEYFANGSPEKSMYTYYLFDYKYEIKGKQNSGKSDGIQVSDIWYMQITNSGNIVFKISFATNQGSFDILVNNENVRRQNNKYQYNCVIRHTVTNHGSGGFKEYRYNATLTAFEKLEMLSRGNIGNTSNITVKSVDNKTLIDFSNITN